MLIASPGRLGWKTHKTTEFRIGGLAPGDLLVVVSPTIAYAPAEGVRLFVGAKAPLGPERRTLWGATAGIELPLP
jgi:hypothetical protein